MSSEVLTSQVVLTDRERCGILTAVEDDIAISVRNVGKMYYLYDRPQDRLKQAFLCSEVRKRYGKRVSIVTDAKVWAGVTLPARGKVKVRGR